MRATARKPCGAGAGACHAVLLILFSVVVHADTHSDILHVFGSMSNALTAANAAQFMDAFDRNMPDYDRIKSNVAGLMQQGQISGSAQPVRDDGDNQHRTVDLDWYLEVQPSDPSAPAIRRRGVVHCRLEKLNKHWRVVALDPVSFFAPQNINSQ